MNTEFELIAKTFMGLEPVLAQELTELGANNVEIGRRMVSFTGNKELMYRANFALHTAIKILKPICHFKAQSAEDVYNEVMKVDWSKYLDNSKTFAVDAVVFSDEFRHSKFVSYKVKDAIVDQFREKTGQRPNISVSNPDLRLNMHIAEDKCTLSLDSSGESLHRRGYRQESVEAPLNEVLAAGMILMTGWKGETDFIDPMCGSGTLLIEAALIARNMAPGLFRKEYAFEKWQDFDADLFDRIYNDDSAEREFNHHIYGYDIDMKAVNTARINVRAAGLTKDITVEQQDFKDFEKPKEKSIIITNPPYGERISTPNILATYKMIGERLKHAFTGNDAWILSYREECFDQIGLKPSIKIPVYNGSLECEFRRYQMFDGRMNIFRSEGGIVKTEEEKQQMAEKHRFKKNREFKRRLDEDLENEEADIRSFKFHSFERQEERERQQRKAERRKMFDRQDDEGHSFDRGRKPFNKDRRPFDRDKKSFSRDRDSFGKDRKPYHHDDRRMGKERSGSKGRSNFNRNRGDK
jgi:putative N6-adenine-specific DNA methylase